MPGSSSKLTTKQMDAFLENQKYQIEMQQQQLEVQSQQITFQENQIEVQKLDIESNKEIALASIAAQKDHSLQENANNKVTIVCGIIAVIVFSGMAFYFHKSELIGTLVGFVGAFIGGLGWNISKNKA